MENKKFKGNKNERGKYGDGPLIRWILRELGVGSVNLSFLLVSLALDGRLKP